MSQMEPATQPTAIEVPPIAGNLWWDDVRQGVGFILFGLGIYLVPFLVGGFFATWFNAIFWVVSAGAIILGLKTCLSVPAEANARMFAFATLGTVKLVLIAAIVLLVTGHLAEAGLVLLAIGLIANILLALFIRNVAGYLRARSLSLLAFQYAMLAAVISVAIVVAAYREARFVTDILTLLLIAIQLFLIGNLYVAIERVQKGLPAEAVGVPAPAVHEPVAVGHSAEPDPIPAVPPPYFTEKQWEMLETSDKSAGRAVIGLMTAIFVIGVLLYSVVAFLAAISKPQS